MDIVELQGMRLIGLEWNEVRLHLRAINDAGEIFEATLSNPGQSPMDVKVHWLDLRMIRDDHSGMYSFGEIEAIGLDRGVVHIEADAGFFSVTAAKIFVQPLVGQTGNEA
jgi:hypothetical protein